MVKYSTCRVLMCVCMCVYYLFCDATWQTISENLILMNVAPTINVLNVFCLNCFVLHVCTCICVCICVFIVNTKGFFIHRYAYILLCESLQHASITIC